MAVAVALVGMLPTTAIGGSDVELVRATPTANDQDLSQRVEQLEGLLKAQQQRIQSLEGEVSTLEERSADGARVAEVKRIVAELMSDGGFRESLYPDVQQVGYDRGFYIKSSDEKFLLKINGYMHFRWTGMARQTDDPTVVGRQKRDDINAFEIEDLFLTFGGHIHDPKLTYKIVVLGDTDSAHNWRTYNAYINYAAMPELQFTAGLVKLPFGRQELSSKSTLQFVDRSLANEFFNLDRSIALAVHGTIAKKLTYIAGIANGIANANDTIEQMDTNFIYGGRLIAHLLGGPIMTESDLAFSKDPQLEVGMSMGFGDDNGDLNPGAWYSIPDRIRRGRGLGGTAVADLTGTDYFQFGADVAFRYRGFSATAEYWVRTIDGDSKYSQWELLTGRDDATHQQGGYVQVGYFVIPKKVEVAGRLGGVWDHGNDAAWEYAVGVNYFPFSTYNVLVQADYTRISESPCVSSSANWGLNDEVDMVRVQLQVKF